MFFSKGAKKADLVALLEKAELPSSPPVEAAEAENSNDIAQEIEKISAEDDLTKVDEDEDEVDEDETTAEPKKDEKEPGKCSIFRILTLLKVHFDL